MSLRSNRPAPAPPSGGSKQLKRQIFNSFLSKPSQETNNNFKNLAGPTVIRATGAITYKKKPPPRPAPPKNFKTVQNGTQGSSQVCPPPDLLADLHDIFGPPLVHSAKSNTNPSAFAPRLNSQRWKKAPAPPKPSAAAIRNARSNLSNAEQLSLIDFDSFVAAAPSAVSKSQANAALDLLSLDPFDSPSSNTTSAFKSGTISANTFQAFSNNAPNYFLNNTPVLQPLNKTLSLKSESVSSSDSWSSSEPPRRLSVFSPPEPKFPPPPPPANDQSEMAKNSGKAIYCRALFDFQGADSEELSFMSGESILLKEQVSDDWWRGSYRGQSGLFPSSYVQLESEVTPVLQEPAILEQKGCFVTALYDFEAEQSQDLSFFVGDTVEVLYRMNQNWLYGKCHGREGQFPANFVQKNGISDAMTCVAKHQFIGENADELSFEVGHVIVIVEKVSSDWWKGYQSHDCNKKGLFPASFVEELS